MHLVSEHLGPEHLRLVRILFHAGGAGATLGVDHGSRLCRWFPDWGIRPQEMRLSGGRAGWLRRFSPLAQLLWQRDADLVHIHGTAAAAAGLAAARWLDLPVIFTPAAPAPAAPRPRLLAGLGRPDPARRADGLVLLGDAPTPPARKPVLLLPAGAPAARIGDLYQGLLREIDRRLGREPRPAPVLPALRAG